MIRPRRFAVLGERPMLALALLPGAIAINLGVSYLVNLLKLPAFGDSWGTFTMGALFGPWVGAIAGVSSNLLGGVITNPYMPAYSLTAAFIGAYAGLAARRGWLDSPLRAAVAGLALGICTAVISAPVTTYLFGGVSAAGAFSYIVAFAVHSGHQILSATVFAGLISDPVDKLITAVLVSFVIAALPQRLRGRFPGLRRREPKVAEAASDQAVSSPTSA